MDARSDPWVFRIVVVFLGLVAFGSAGGATLLAARHDEIPGGLTNLGSTAIGALSGLLAALLGPKPRDVKSS